MIKYVVFTNDELDAIKNGTPVSSCDSKNTTMYVSEEYYNKMMEDCLNKEFEDD